jgi:alpha-tubulin suppressor-like RCC1 family protein
VYVWGSNTEGQLGLGPEAEEAVYTPVLLNLHFKVILRVSWD